MVWNNGLKLTRSNFAGPGTNVVDRIKRGDKGVTIADKISNAHDIDYDKSKNMDDIRAADLKMMNNLTKTMSWKAPVESVNNAFHWLGIAGKVAGEKLGLFGKDTFTDFGNFYKRPKEEQELLSNRRQELANEGLGMKHKKR